MIKKYMSILAIVVALCGVMTVGANATNYEIYESLVWDEENFPYVAAEEMKISTFADIMPELADYGNLFEEYYVWASSTPMVYDESILYPYENLNAVAGPAGPCNYTSYSYTRLLCTRDTFITAITSIGLTEEEAVASYESFLVDNEKWIQGEVDSLDDGSMLRAFVYLDASGSGEYDPIFWTNHDIYNVDTGELFLEATGSYEPPPTTGGGTLEAITVFFSADWLSYDSGIVSVGLEDLDPTKTYMATVYLYEKGGSTSDPLRTSMLTGISGETYNNALVFTGLDVNTEYETSIVVSCGEDTVGEATASFSTPDYDYAINVLSTNVQYNTFSCEIEVTGLPEYEIDNPDCWVYVSATLNDGTSEPDKWLNSNTNLNGNKARIYFTQTQLDSETEYTLTLEIFRTTDDWTKGESTGVTETVTFTTEAAYVADEEEDSEDTSTKDEAAEKFEEWDTVTDIPEDVTDKTNEGDKLLNDMDTLEKPDPDEAVPDLSVDLVPVNGFFDAIFGYGLIVEMMTMAAGFALVATVLFGKRG